MKNPIPPDHYYIPSAENDPVRDEIHRIFKEAFQPHVCDATVPLEQIRVSLEDNIDWMLKESFTSVYARPTVQVSLDVNNNRPMFLIAAMVYGHTFTATLS